MIEFKECVKIKREFTKKYEGKNLVLDLTHYPDYIALIVTHGDGKSWAYFFGKYYNNDVLLPATVFLGRSNKSIQNFLLSHLDNTVVCTNNVIISDNPEVKRVYSDILNTIKREIWYFECHVSVYYLFVINPVLATNIVDADIHTPFSAWEDKTFTRVSSLIDLVHCGNVEKPLIKDAFGISPKWLNVCLKNGIKTKLIKLFIKYGYTVSDLGDIPNSLLECFDESVISNRNCLKLVKESGWRYRDYLRMLKDLPEELTKGYPKVPQDLKKQHDRISKLYNHHAYEIQALKNKERNEKYQSSVYLNAIKYEFENNDYSIIACKQLEDLFKEGKALSHCVGSYTNSVLEGKEYILFLRKKSDIDTPYFTIDLLPDKRVRQIHGFCNCNMNSEIEPFVKQWADKFGLDLSDCSGVKCALSWCFKIIKI